MRTTATSTTPGRPARLRRLAATTAGAMSLVTLTVALTACGTGDSSSSGTGSPATTSATTPDTTPTGAAAAPLTVKDPWAKAADSGMTAVFGTLVNTTGAQLTVVSATSSVAKKTELHEVADVDGQPVMRPKKGGFVIPAKGSHELQPGADHLMLMGLTGALQPGDEMTVSLTLKDGRRLRFTAVAKAFAGGKENYDSGMNMKKG